MLKFIRQYADKIGGIEIYPLISLVIFVVFFLGVLIYVRKMKPSSVEEMSKMPLDLEADSHSKTA
jgi:cytochrome c oxidase cbb3-type subunit IV